MEIQCQGMVCPKCGNHGSTVIDSRANDDAFRRRRHVCLKRRCKYRFTTYEIYDSAYRSTQPPDMVIIRTAIDLLRRIEESY